MVYGKVCESDGKKDGIYRTGRCGEIIIKSLLLLKNYNIPCILKRDSKDITNSFYGVDEICDPG